MVHLLSSTTFFLYRFSFVCNRLFPTFQRNSFVTPSTPSSQMLLHLLFPFTSFELSPLYLSLLSKCRKYALLTKKKKNSCLEGPQNILSFALPLLNGMLRICSASSSKKILLIFSTSHSPFYLFIKIATLELACINETRD